MADARPSAGDDAGAPAGDVAPARTRPRPLPMPAADRVDLLGLDLPALSAFLQALGQPRFRARQLYRWMHHRAVLDVEAMTDLPKDLRAVLAERATVGGGLALLSRLDSADGTIKLVCGTADGQRIETVLIPADDRLTQCVSSQIGCRIGCAFCLTATMPLRRDLTPGEILAQVYLGVAHAASAGRRVTNLVYMGMGEPLDNLDAVATSVDRLMDTEGQGFGARRITVSTSGLAQRLPTFFERLPVRLAVSLNASNDEVRDRLIPHNRTYPIGTLLDAVQAAGPSARHRVTIEYVLLDGVTDTPAHAGELVALLRDFRPTVNLIPFNPYPGAAFGRPSDAAVDAFGARLRAAGLEVTVRRSRGQDVGAACGMLDGAPDGAPDGA